MLIALLLALVAQDTTGLSPRARAMLDRFPLPRSGEVSIATHFSTDTAWFGEQVELVTAAWFPRELRNRLRHTPNLLPPALSGLWSVQAQANMSMAATRVVGGQLYDLFVAHQTLFPLGGGKITVPPAILTYSVPASLSFFAPEQRKTLSSRPATLVIRPIPARLSSELGSGPTARGVKVLWRGVSGPIHAGTPAMVELVIAGEGNIALWPAPEVSWPSGIRVYPDRTEERPIDVAGRRGGEKRFRFTVVADSEGVLSLPQVRYPYFDPATSEVSTAMTDAVALVVLPGTGAGALRRVLPIVAEAQVPVASDLVALAPWAFPLLFILPLLVVLWRRRRRVPRVVPSPARSPESELRDLLGTRGEASPETVVPVLRRRGVPREDAEGVRQWLTAASRRRYGPPGSDVTPPPAPLARVLKRLRSVIRLAPLIAICWVARAGAQSLSDGVARYQAGEYHEAALAFDQARLRTPNSVGSWRNLAAAHWLEGDDVGAAAAWVRALELAPRDAVTRAEWHGAGGIPAEVRALAPSLPVSRDELLLISLVGWLLGWLLAAFRIRRLPLLFWCVALVALGWAGFRFQTESQDRALLKPGSTLRISPHPAAPSLGEGAAWTLARVEQQRAGWLLVRLDGGRRGWLPASAVAPLGPLD
ncbi:MAG: SH3 domain-containing protein [Gemmatimonadales bacterium]